MFVMDSNAKGNVAEQAIVFEATRHGVPVFRPVGEHERCDLILDVADRLWRVQCKWGRLSPDRDVVRVKLGRSRCTPGGYVRTTYAEEEVDLFGVYCGELDRCFLISGALGCGRREIWLRLTAARNNQRSCVNLADDFDFVGAIAQLGERVTGSHEVAGSSPASSILSATDDRAVVIGSNCLRDRFGYWMDRAAAGHEILITRHGSARVRMTAASVPLPPTLTPASLEPPRTPHTAP